MGRNACANSPSSTSPLGSLRARVACAYPLPADRRADRLGAQRGRGLEDAACRTALADLCVQPRRADRGRQWGPDERFARAYREDSDLALRLYGRWLGAGAWPARRSCTAWRSAGPWAEPRRKQAGNADDVLMDAIHGRGWRERAGSAARAACAPTWPPPRWAPPRSAPCWRTALASRPAFAAGAGAAMGELAWRRIAPVPRDAREIATMAATSAMLPASAAGTTCAAAPRPCPAPLSAAPAAPRPAGPLLRSSTATARWWSTSPTTRSRARRAAPRRGRALDRRSPRTCALVVISNQSGIAPRRCSRRPRSPAVARSRERRLRAARLRSGATARTAPTPLRVPQAAPGPAPAGGAAPRRWAPIAAPSWATSPVTSRPRRPPARAAQLGAPTSAPAPEEIPSRRPRASRPKHPRRAACRPCCLGPALITHVLYAVRTTPATCCWPVPPCAPWPRARQRVTLLCGPAGAEAARLLPGVDEAAGPGRRVDRGPSAAGAPATTSSAAIDEPAALRALTECSNLICVFHQSPLPLALLLRMAGVAVYRRDLSEDYPGRCSTSLTTCPTSRMARHGAASPCGEPRHGLHAACCDDDRLRAARPSRPRPAATGHVVVHPGASVPARAWAPDGHAALVRALARRGRRAIVDGAPERAGPHPSRRGDRRAGPRRAHVAGRAGGPAGRCRMHRGGNTGPRTWPRRRHAGRLAVRAHGPGGALAPVGGAARAAAVAVPCAGCRARACPVPGHRASTTCGSRTSWPRSTGSARTTGRWRHEDPALARPRLVDHGARAGPPRVPPCRWLPVRGPDGRGRAHLGLAGERRRGHARAGAPPTGRRHSPAPGRARAPRARMARGPADAHGVPGTQRAAGPDRGYAPPAADRDDLVVVHVTHFNDLFWDCGRHARRASSSTAWSIPATATRGDVPRAAVVINEAAPARARDGDRPARGASSRGVRRPLRHGRRALGGRRSMPQPACTTRSPSAGSICTRSGGPRSGSR